MASKSQIKVGGVSIGGGAPVVVQSMTLTKTHDVEATTAQIAALASAGCEIVRVAVPKNEDAAALPEDRAAVAAPGDRGHPLQRLSRSEGDRRRRRGRPHQPGQHRRTRAGRGGRQGSEGEAGADADRRQCGIASRASARPRPQGHVRGARRRGDRAGGAAREARLPQLQDLRQGLPCADHDPRLPDAGREGPLRFISASRRQGRRSRARSRAPWGWARC